MPFIHRIPCTLPRAFVRWCSNRAHHGKYFGSCCRLGYQCWKKLKKMMMLWCWYFDVWKHSTSNSLDLLYEKMTVNLETSPMVKNAVWGVIPAVFTFGLSIPFCAAVGGGAGRVYRALTWWICHLDGGLCLASSWCTTVIKANYVVHAINRSWRKHHFPANSAYVKYVLCHSFRNFQPDMLKLKLNCSAPFNFWPRCFSPIIDDLTHVRFGSGCCQWCDCWCIGRWCYRPKLTIIEGLGIRNDTVELIALIISQDILLKVSSFHCNLGLVSFP